MADLHPSPSQQTAEQTNSSTCVEVKLRQLFTQRRKLRATLDATRVELDRVNAEVLRIQDDYCTSPEREEEYLQYLEKILGYNPRIDPKELEAALKDPQSIEDFLAELEQPSQG
jgi:hypothetical protein